MTDSATSPKASRIRHGSRMKGLCTSELVLVLGSSLFVTFNLPRLYFQFASCCAATLRLCGLPFDRCLAKSAWPCDTCQSEAKEAYSNM